MLYVGPDGTIIDDGNVGAIKVMEQIDRIQARKKEETMIPLKNCPFCGKQPESMVYAWSDVTGQHIEVCVSCGTHAVASREVSKDGRIPLEEVEGAVFEVCKEWNTRKGDADVGSI